MTTVARIVCGGVLLAALTSDLCAQNNAAAMGSVSGVITCSDTQRPARFAKVTLMPVKSASPAPKALDNESADDPAAAMKAMTALMSSVTMLQAQTGLDGTYTLTGVAPGDYYLSPAAPGYVSPVAAAPGAGKEPPPGATVVHVEANHTARGDAVLERGAALGGTVVFDDGTPAAGVMIHVMNANKDGGEGAGDNFDFGQVMASAMSGSMMMATTDDRGRFRVAGIPSGDYLVQATILVTGGFSMRGGVMDLNAAKAASALKYFAPGTLHKADAAKLTVRAGDEHGDIEIKVTLTGMHTVSGRVLSLVDHHALNQATVTLTDNSDKSVERSAIVDASGTFTVSYVPSGSYTLDVSDGADVEPAKKKPGGGVFRISAVHTLKSYEDAKQPVIVAASDITGVSVELKESKTTKKDVDFGDLLGGGSPKE